MERCLGKNISEILKERDLLSHSSCAVNYSKYFLNQKEFIKELYQHQNPSMKFSSQKHNELVKGIQRLFKGCSHIMIMEVLGVIMPKLSEVLRLYLQMNNSYQFLLKNLGVILGTRMYNKWSNDPAIPPGLLADMKNILSSLDPEEEPPIEVYIYI